jgi:inorganic pyrophosphatase/exopolyphosphatase
LVAQEFCENRYKGTETKTEVHHKDRNRQNNKSKNLIILSIAEHHKIHQKETKENE